MKYTYLNVEAMSSVSVKIISLNLFCWCRDWNVRAIYCSNNSSESFQKIKTSVYQLLSIIIDGVFVYKSILPAILEKPSFMATVGKCPGNTMKVFMYLWSAMTTLRMVRQTVFLLSFSASPTSYRYVPLAKNRKAIQIICGTVVAWLRRVGFLIWGSRSRQRYNIPSAENLYLSYKCSSENASGFCLSFKTLSLRKALCTIWAPMSTGFSKYGEAILLLLRML